MGHRRYDHQAMKPAKEAPMKVLLSWDPDKAGLNRCVVISVIRLEYPPPDKPHAVSGRPVVDGGILKREKSY